MIDPTLLRKRLPYLMPEIRVGCSSPLLKPRISLDGTATTPPTIDSLEAMIRASFQYGPFERGASDAAQHTSIAVTRVYNLLANLIGADSWKQIVLGRNTTEMIGHVVHTLQRSFEGFPRFKSGQNIVTTYLEHNSNYLPWVELRNSLRGWGVNIDVRLVNVNPLTGELDMKDLQRKVDRDTRVVSVSGKSNVLGTTPHLGEVGLIAHQRGALFIVDGAQYVPGSFVDVRSIDVDLLTFSLHKMLAPFGVGVLYGKRELLERMPPFIPGGGTVNRVELDTVEYHDLPQKFIAGSPDSLGIIASGESVLAFLYAGLGMFGDERQKERAFTKMILNAPSQEWDLRYQTSAEEGASIRAYALETGRAEVLQDVVRRRELAREFIATAMRNVREYQIMLTSKVLTELADMPDVQVYGNLPAERRYGLVPFNVRGIESRAVGMEMAKRGIEIRADKHCAHLLHSHVLRVSGTARVSLSVYNTAGEVGYFTDTLREVAPHV